MGVKRQWPWAAALAAGLLIVGCARQPAKPVAPSAPSAPAAPTAVEPEPAETAPVDTVPIPPAQPLEPPPKPPLAPAPPPAPEPATAPGKLVAAQWGDLPGWRDDQTVAAYPAFLASCRVLPKRAQAWTAVCARAKALGGGHPTEAQWRAFLEAELRPWRVLNSDGSREGLVTGYYEPLIRGSRTRGSNGRAPVLGVPGDLISVELGDQYPELKPLRLRGRLEGRRLVPYWSRAEITAREAGSTEKVLLWAQDPIELFFLQVQGSGLVQLDDGSTTRLGYADQNGHPYRSIGRWLVDRGELPLDKASMQGIKEWARARPERITELLNANPSYIFFRELPADGGPPGAAGVPLSAGRSIAVDKQTVPLGAPVFLDSTQPNSAEPLRRLVMAQDTGTAIRGGVRADFFWGGGDSAGVQAGRMRSRGAMWVLWPTGQTPR